MGAFPTRERALTSSWSEKHTSMISKFKMLQLEDQDETSLHNSQKTHDQTQSLLFTLPFEIRQMIWKEVLVVGMIHIIPLRDSLGHIRCMDQNGNRWNWKKHNCWVQGFIRLGLTVAPESYPRPEEIPGVYPSLLALLKTCRQIYTEGIDYLYKENAFDFRNLEVVPEFTTGILPHRLDLIKTIQISHSSKQWYSWIPSPKSRPSWHELLWKRGSQAILRCRGLESFRVQLDSMYTPRSPEDRTWMLKELLCFQGLRVFEVRISWEVGPTASLLKSRPFDLEGAEGEIVKRTQAV